jgi:hypothetical protein
MLGRWSRLASLLAGAYLIGLSLFFGLFFFGSLRGYLRRSAAAERLAAIVFAGGALFAVAGSVGSRSCSGRRPDADRLVHRLCAGRVDDRRRRVDLHSQRGRARIGRIRSGDGRVSHARAVPACPALRARFRA